MGPRPFSRGRNCGGVAVGPVGIGFKAIPGSEGVKVIPLSGQSAITEPVTSLADNIIEKVARYWESREKKPSHTSAVDIE